MQALAIGRRLSLIGIAISAAVIIFALSGVGLSMPSLGPGVLAVAGLVPGIATGALLLRASPPPRTPWGVHIAIMVLVSAAVIAAVLGGIGWAAQLDQAERGLPATALSTASGTLLYAGIVLTAAAVGLLAAQLLPAGGRILYIVIAVAPAVIVLVFSLLPGTSTAIRDLTFSTWNLALGAIFVSPFAALSAYVVTNDAIKKRQKRAAV